MLAKERYVYIWADGIYCRQRGENGLQCLLVVIGVTDNGEKHFLAIEEGQRESKESWRALLGDLKSRGMNQPRLAVGDGALGFWASLAEVFPKTAAQRCWVHKTRNVLNCLPKVLQAKAKTALQQIWMAPSRDEAIKAVKKFTEVYGGMYPKAIAKIEKDLDELLTFYNFTAQHWASIRTTNPILSTFATIRHRTRQSRSCFSRVTTLSMVYKLAMEAQKRRRRMKGYGLLGKVELGMKCKDGRPSRNNLSSPTPTMSISRAKH